MQLAQSQAAEFEPSAGLEELVLRIGSPEGQRRRGHWIPARGPGLDQGGARQPRAIYRVVAGCDPAAGRRRHGHTAVGESLRLAAAGRTIGKGDEVFPAPAEWSIPISPRAAKSNCSTEEFRKLDQQLNRARTDLEDRHRRELELERELLRADRLATIGTLAAGLAHEIGTPMGVIRVRAESLQAGRDYFGGLARQARHHRPPDRSDRADRPDAARLLAQERIAQGDLRPANDRRARTDAAGAGSRASQRSERSLDSATIR